MDVRLVLYQLAVQHGLDSRDTKRLHELAGLNAEPEDLSRRLAIGAAVLAAALGGLGIVFWVAANWESYSRIGRFALLQGFFLAMCAGALAKPAARTPLSLLSLLAIGALFAYFGQTYQTGADAWQLFALWALLSLPLCFSVRNDALWVPWSLVAMSTLSLWMDAHMGSVWRMEANDLAGYLGVWSGALILTFALSPLLRPYTGAGPWALRASVALSIIIIVGPALAALFAQAIGTHYWIAVLMLAGTAVIFTLPRLFDLFALSALGLGLNLLLVGGIAHVLFRDHGESIGRMMVLGLAAAVLLAATVSLVLRVSRIRLKNGEAV